MFSTQVVLYKQCGIAMRRPKIELCATPRAQHVQNHDGLRVLWVHRTEPPSKIVALDLAPELGDYGSFVVKEQLRLAQRTAGVQT